MQLSQKEITRLQNSVKYLENTMQGWPQEKKEAHLRFGNRMSGGGSGFYIDKNGNLQHSSLIPPPKKDQ